MDRPTIYLRIKEVHWVLRETWTGKERRGRGGVRGTDRGRWDRSVTSTGRDVELIGETWFEGDQETGVQSLGT